MEDWGKAHTGSNLMGVDDDPLEVHEVQPPTQHPQKNKAKTKHQRQPYNHRERRRTIQFIVVKHGPLKTRYSYMYMLLQRQMYSLELSISLIFGKSL